MADEPRRSGRATKGQHKNHEPADTPKAKKPAASSSSKKSSKKSAEPEEEEEESEDVIRCVCNDTSEDGGGKLFLSCDGCGVWQHSICLGLPLEEDKLPEHYMCEQCQPDDHAELLAAMERGEKPWEERQKEQAERERIERNRKKAGKRKSKGARPSRVSDVRSELPSDQVSASPAPATTPASAPAPSQDSAQNNKRKFEDEPTASSPPVVPEERRRGSSAATKRRKSEPEPKQDKDKDKDKDKDTEKDTEKDTDKVSLDVDTALVDMEQLPKERQNVAGKLATIIADNVRQRVTAGSHTLKEGETAESLGRHHASRIEYELYQVHGAPSQSPHYASQFRAIIANVKTNRALIHRLLSGSLTAHGLATMTSQEMASEELQRERQQLKEEADKQAVMIREEDDKPRVRRTHKGDEYIDEQESNTHESVFTSQPVRSREQDQEKPPTPPVADSAATVAGAEATPDRMEIDSADATRRQSQQQQFDIKNVWAQTADTDQPHAQPARSRNSIAKTPVEKGEKVDPDVDRMLDDDRNDQDYVPPENPDIVWRGLLVQPGVTEFTACARHVGGNDFSRFMPWSSFFPAKLEIEGRLEAKRADDYLCGLQWSVRSDVSVLVLTPYDNRAAFDQVFEYFATRERYAVVRKGHGMSNIVKDVYISPIGPQNRLPPHLALLTHNDLEGKLSDRMLLVTFVVNKPAHWDPPAEPTATEQQAIQSPINGHGPQFSPRPAQGFTPLQNGHQNQYQAPMPPSPYAQPPGPATYPMAGPPPQAQAYPSPHPYQPHPNPVVERILGPLSSSPVVAAILNAAGDNIQEHVLVNMRDILSSDPASRDDLNVFYQRLGQLGSQQQA